MTCKTTAGRGTGSQTGRQTAADGLLELTHTTPVEPMAMNPHDVDWVALMATLERIMPCPPMPHLSQAEWRAMWFLSVCPTYIDPEFCCEDPDCPNNIAKRQQR